MPGLGVSRVYPVSTHQSPWETKLSDEFNIGEVQSVQQGDLPRKPTSNTAFFPSPTLNFQGKGRALGTQFGWLLSFYKHFSVMSIKSVKTNKQIKTKKSHTNKKYFLTQQQRK